VLLTRPLLALFCLCTLAHAQATLPPDQVLSFDPKVVRAPVPIDTPIAEMPDQARRRHLAGFCAVAVIVDQRGHPQNVRVVRCTDSMFSENSLNAVRNYRFRPATSLQDNKPVPCKMTIEVSYGFEPNRDPIPRPRPRIKVGFLVPSQPVLSGPDNNGIYALSRDFDPPNSLPTILRFADTGFSRAAFLLDDGAGCIAELTIDERGQPTDAKITECNSHSLEAPAMRSLLKSQFSPAILKGKAVPVRTSVHLVCEGFGPPSVP
jgi:TonB family protein